MKEINSTVLKSVSGLLPGETDGTNFLLHEYDYGLYTSRQYLAKISSDFSTVEFISFIAFPNSPSTGCKDIEIAPNESIFLSCSYSSYFQDLEQYEVYDQMLGNPDEGASSVLLIYKIEPEVRSIIFAKAIAINGYISAFYKSAVGKNGNLVFAFGCQCWLNPFDDPSTTPRRSGSKSIELVGLSSDGNALTFGTTLDSSSGGAVLALEADGKGSVYLVGTASADFPGTPNASLSGNVQPGGNFVSKLSQTDGSLEASTHLGGGYFRSFDVDDLGRPYLAIELSATTVFPISSMYSTGGTLDPAIIRLSTDLSAIEQGTYMQQGVSELVSIKVTAKGVAFVATTSHSSDLTLVNDLVDLSSD
jgi:hypothetical protein